MIELVEPAGGETSRTYRADLGRSDIWVVCHDREIFCEVARSRVPGEPRERARRIAASLSMTQGFSVAELEGFVLRGQVFKAYDLKLTSGETEKEVAS
jgi:hypothetical protein